MTKQRRGRRTANEAIDEQVVRMRTAGCSFADIKRATGAKPERIRRIVADWVEASVDPELRKRAFVELLAQIDEVIRGLYPKAVAGEPQAVLALNRVWGRRINLLGLKVPEHHVLKIVAEDVPKPLTTSDRIEAALAQLTASESPAARRERLRRELRQLEHQPADDEANKPAPTNGHPTQ